MPINKAPLTRAEYNRVRNQVALNGGDVWGYDKYLDKPSPKLKT